MNKVIKVQNLAKKYQIKHQKKRYHSLAEDLSDFFSKIIHSFSHKTKDNQRAFTKEDFWALKNINFDVQQGERIGIIGMNGAGKSTLLKILSRITDPTNGRVEISGRVSSLLEVGTGFHPELTGRENIFLNGAILGMKIDEVRKKFDQIVAFAEVEKFLDTPVKRYSSGMYVRLAFAVAAHLEPDILIIDEVLAVGDAQFQKKCLGRMEELSETGRTILFVTHNMDAMLALCTRGIVLNKGRVVFDGLPTDAREFYLSQVSSNKYSIDNNAGRGGSGGVTITNVRIINDHHEIDTIESGRGLSIHILAMVSENYKQRSDLQVALGIDSLEGQRLYTVLTSWSDTSIDSSSGLISVVCDIDSIPFIPGTYLVSASIIFQSDTLDSIEHCASFSVIPRERAIHVERLPGWGLLDLKSSFRNIKKSTDK